MGKIRDLFEGWVLKIALKKAAKAAASVVGSAAVLQQAGVSVDPLALETWLTATGAGLVTMLLNWLKVKTSLGKKFL